VLRMCAVRPSPARRDQRADLAGARVGAVSAATSER